MIVSMKKNFKQTDEDSLLRTVIDSVRISVHSSVRRPASAAVYGSIKRTVPASLEFDYKYITRTKKLEIVETIRWEIDQEIWEYEFPEKKIYTNTTK